MTLPPPPAHSDKGRRVLVESALPPNSARTASSEKIVALLHRLLFCLFVSGWEGREDGRVLFRCTGIWRIPNSGLVVFRPGIPLLGASAVRGWSPVVIRCSGLVVFRPGVLYHYLAHPQFGGGDGWAFPLYLFLARPQFGGDGWSWYIPIYGGSAVREWSCFVPVYRYLAQPQFEGSDWPSR